MSTLPPAAIDERWLPIETWDGGDGEAIFGRFEPRKWPQVVAGFKDVGGTLRVLGRNGGNIRFPFVPTHWQPLGRPRPPENGTPS